MSLNRFVFFKSVIISKTLECNMISKNNFLQGLLFKMEKN